jgi:uncharacterized peroxidase-related enzyme
MLVPSLRPFLFPGIKGMTTTALEPILMSNMPIPKSIDVAPEVSRPLLEVVKAHLGVVPNMFRLLANSPATLESYLGFSTALGQGAVDHKTREPIALTVAQLDRCDYCLSAHTYLGRNVTELDDNELIANRNGTSHDRKAEAAVMFAAKLVQGRGRVGGRDVDEIGRAGYSDGEILEGIGHVALNTFTNYVNEALGTVIDLPLIHAV